MFNARSISGLLLSFVLCPIFISAPAQSQSADARLRLVSSVEGDAIVQAAWDLRRGLTPKPDCSHFVNAVYSHAGYLYQYAESRAVFAGIAGFRRVRTAQPGDLIVWQGHIGIVIDPREHSFYSSVLTGFAIENYRSNYWIRRGNPRFYRFLVNDWQGARLVLSSFTQALPASDQLLLTLMRLFPASSQPPALKATGMATNIATPEVSRRPSARREAEPAALSKAESVPVPTTIPMTSDDEIFVTSQATPSRREVLAAVVRAADGNGERLLRNGLLDSQPSVGVADCFRITALNLKGKHGLADLEVKEIATLRYGRLHAKRAIARRHVVLSRQEQGWVLLLPQDLVYLHPRVAGVLTNRLAAISPALADRQEAKTTVTILRELTPEKSAGPSAGSPD